MTFSTYLKRLEASHEVLRRNGTVEKFSGFQVHPALLAHLIRLALPSEGEEREWETAFWYYVAKELGKKDARRLKQTLKSINKYVTSLKGE